MRKDALISVLLCSLLTACGGGSKDSNKSPTISPLTLQTNEDSSVSGQVIVKNAQTDALAFSISDGIHGTATINGSGLVTYTPAENYHGSDALTVTVNDGKKTITSTIAITVISINDVPVLSARSQSLVEDTPVSFLLSANDADGDTLTYSIKTNGAHGTASITSAGFISYQPDTNFNGTDVVTVAVSDGQAAASADITYTVVPDNDAPAITAATFVSRDDQIISGSVSATDVDGDSLTFAQTPGQTLPAGTAFNLSTDGSFTFSNSTTTNASINIKVTVSDGSLETEGTLTFTTQTDPLLGQQWHLHNTGQTAFSANGGTSGQDINIGTLHKDGQTGAAVIVAVVDSGMEIGHEDLSPNVLAGRSYDYLHHDTDPTSSATDGDHGTSVAGLIAAKGYNGIGGRGVAPDASLMGFNWLETQDFTEWQQNHGGNQTSDAQVVNQSYGANSSSPLTFFDSWNSAAESHLRSVQSTNNNGKGIFFSKSAGNEFEYYSGDITIAGADYDTIITDYYWNNGPDHLSSTVAGIDPENSSFYYTVVSALNANATNPLSSYSSVGAAVWVSAPGGEYGQNSPAMITTDQSGCFKGYARNGENGFDGGTTDNANCNYTSTFNGTSSAAPVVSGVAALVLAANNQLSWRDVRHILAATARKIDPDFTPVSITNGSETFVAEPGWITNAAGYHFHNWYGFGMVDASAAVALAQNPSYTLLPALVETDFMTPTNTSSVSIPENNTGASKTIAVTQDLTVEAIQIKISATHARDADLAIEVTSPSGTTSMVLEPQSLLVGDQNEKADGSEDFNDTVLLSNAFYSENSLGNWTVKVTDTNSGSFVFWVYNSATSASAEVTATNGSGTLDAIALKIYGH